MQRRGFILTGGRSSRLGRDKALLPVSGGTLAEHLAGMLPGPLAPPRCWADRNDTASSYPCIPDLRPGLGPLWGIEAALSQTETDAQPDSRLRHARYHRANAESSFSEARRTETPLHLPGPRDATGAFHPLCAVYRRRAWRPFKAPSTAENVGCFVVDRHGSGLDYTPRTCWRTSILLRSGRRRLHR